MIQLLRQLIAREIGIRQALLALGHFLSITRMRSGDDFNWATYHRHYREELKSIGKNSTLNLRPADFEVVDRKLTLTDSVRLLPSHELLYQTIVSLSPKRLLEVGCGGGDHLANLGLLLNYKAELIGVDRSQDQLRFATHRHPLLEGSLSVADISAVGSLPTADIVYSHAVLMHISERDSRFQAAVRNCLSASTQGMVMLENWSQHDYLAAIRIALDDLDKKWEVGVVRHVQDSGTCAIVVSERKNWPLGTRELRKMGELT